MRQWLIPLDAAIVNSSDLNQLMTFAYSVLKRYWQVVEDILSGIIDDYRDSFIEEENFKVRPGYGYDKFYLNWVDQSYDMSLEGLIHYILFEEELYNEFLNDRQLKSVKNVIENYPESIYRPNPNNDDLSYDEYEEEEEAQDNLDQIYYQTIVFVGKKLKAFDHFKGFRDYKIG